MNGAVQIVWAGAPGDLHGLESAISMRAHSAPKETVARRAVLLTATLFAGEATHSVIIRNISATGARLLCKVPLVENCEVVLKKRPIFADARVVWSKQGEAGLQFYSPLPLSQLDFTINSSGAD